MRKRLHSIAVRLAIMFGVALTATSLIAGILLHAFQCKQMRQQKQEELEGRYVIVERLVHHHKDTASWKRLQEKLEAFTPQDQSIYFVIDGPDPEFRFNAELLAGVQTAKDTQGVGEVFINGNEYFILSRNIPENGDRPETRLSILLTQADMKQAQETLAQGTVLISLLSILFASGAGWLIARLGLAPVDRLSEHAGRLGGRDLSVRLPLQNLPLELEGLVLALNEALDRLQASHTQLSRFNADVAHELRTPVHNLIGETQVALNRERSSTEFESVLQSNLEELERLAEIINSMLFLARADQGDGAHNLETLSLASEIEKCAEFMEFLFEETGSALTIHGDAKARIQKSLFGQAVTNLLDNALRHGAPGGEVTVNIRQKEDTITVAVGSQGAPIPDAQLPLLFDRFYRADGARRDSRTSHGLGLSIVEAIASMLGGGVFARNTESGVEIGFTLPGIEHTGVENAGVEHTGANVKPA